VRPIAKAWLDPAISPLRAGFALGGLHGLAMGLAFASVGLWAVVMVAIWPLARVGLRTPRGRLGRAAVMASLGALPFWAWSHQFVLGSSALGFYPLVVYLSIYPGLFVWLLGRVSRRFPAAPLWAVIPVLWVGLEFLRGEIVWDGYAWYLVGQPLIELSAGRRYAPIVGAYGVSAWVALVTGWCFDLARVWSRESPAAQDAGLGATGGGRGAWGLRLVGVLLGLGALGGFTVQGLGPQAKGAGMVRVAVVQTNVPQKIKGDWPIGRRLRDFERFADLTLRASAMVSADGRPVDLIVWPETSFPGFWLNGAAVEREREAGLSFDAGEKRGRVASTYFYDRMLELQRAAGASMVVGAMAAEGVRIGIEADGQVKIETDREFNSVFVIDRGEVSGDRYDKAHLTPFGEVMPYISRWGWLERRLLALGAEGMTFGLTAGTKVTPLGVSLGEGREIRVATPICFEATVAGVCRRMVYGGGGGGAGGVRGADLIAAVTNDGWFHWQNSGRRMHLLVSRWRCAELGVPMARAANTGISALVDGQGRVVAMGVEGGGMTDVEGVLVGDLALPGARGTIYGRVGDVVGKVCGVGMMGLLIVTVGPWRKTRKGGEWKKG